MNAINLESLKVMLGREVPEIHLTIAKASVMGLDPDTIANSLGVEKAEIEELMQESEYKDVRLLVGAEEAKQRVQRDSGWDGIESTALEKLGQRVTRENDTETLLKIAAVANRAQRRVAPPKEAGPLDPSQAGARVPLTLTKRYTEKLSDSGRVIERSEIQQISVLNGSAVNPSFTEVNELLQSVAPREAAGTDITPVNVARTQPASNAPATQQGVIERSESETPFSIDELMAAVGKR